MIQDLSTRIDMAIAYLKKERIIKFQKEVAEKMGVDVNTVSRAKNGGEYNAENFAVNFNAAFDFIFSQEWLLRGTGEMLSAPKHVSHPAIIPDKRPIPSASPPSKAPSGAGETIPSWADSLIQLVSDNTKALESLRRENEQLRAEISQLRADLCAALKALRHHPVTYETSQGSITLPLAAESFNNK